MIAEEEYDHEKYLKNLLEEDKKKVLDELNTEFTMSKLNRLSREDHHFERKRESYKLIKTTLNPLAKWYLRINKFYVNQTLFISNINDAIKQCQEA